MNKRTNKVLRTVKMRPVIVMKELTHVLAQLPICLHNKC